jgi:small neutral amino acid transporter SnatA (MarC family)
MVMGSSGEGDWRTWLGTVVIAWLAASIVLLLGNVIASKIGARGLIALERLMGMFLVAMAVEMLLSGISLYYSTLPR